MAASEYTVQARLRQGGRRDGCLRFPRTLASLAVTAAALLLLPSWVRAASSADDLVAKIKANDIVAVTALLDAGADPSGANAGGEVPLNVALVQRAERVAQLLLSRGADPNGRDKLGQTPLTLLSPMVQLARGGLNEGTLLGLAIRAAQRTPNICARELSAATVAQVLAPGIDVDARDQGITPLMRSAYCGHVTTMRQLLDGGADIRRLSEAGESALLFAAAGGRVEAAQLLLDRGADVNERSGEGATVLLIVARGLTDDHTSLARLLLTLGVNANTQDTSGNSPLLETVRERQPNVGMVELLIQSGADPALANAVGESALSIAPRSIRPLLELQ